MVEELRSHLPWNSPCTTMGEACVPQLLCSELQSSCCASEVSLPQGKDRYLKRKTTNPRRGNTKKTLPRHTQANCQDPKIKITSLKQPERGVYFLRSNSNNDNSLLAETMKVRRKWNGTFKTAKEKKKFLTCYKSIPRETLLEMKVDVYYSK